MDCIDAFAKPCADFAFSQALGYELDQAPVILFSPEDLHSIKVLRVYFGISACFNFGNQ